MKEVRSSKKKKLSDNRRKTQEYYELYANKFDNLNKINRLLEMHNLSKVVEKRENLNSPISILKIELII